MPERVIDLRDSAPDGRDELLTSAEVDVLRLVTRRWTFEILMVLCDGPARYSELLRGLPGIHQRILTQRLKDLEEMGLVDRLETREVPRRSDALGPGKVQVTYSLNDAGATLRPALRALRQWIRTAASPPPMSRRVGQAASVSAPGLR